MSYFCIIYKFVTVVYEKTSCENTIVVNENYKLA